MRRLAIVLAASLLMGGVYTPDIGPGPLGQDQSGGWSLVWWSNTDRNGVSDEDALPSGFPTPSIAWFGWDPLVNHGSAGGAFAVEDGATTAEGTPFCPDGDFSDLTDSGAPATKSCLQARYFDGNDSYVSVDTTLGNPGTTDYSICAIYRNETAASGMLGHANTVSDNGIGIYFGAYNFNLVYKHTVGTQTETTAKPSAGQWAIGCASTDYDGNIMTIVNNDTAGGTTASTAGNLNAGSEGFTVGELHGTAARYTGAILAVYAWPTTALSVAQIKQFTSYWMGLLPMVGTTVSPTTITTGGPTCYWVGGKLSCYADDFPVIGAEVPPGLTGGGASGGLMTVDALTNKILRSRDPSASWAVTGTLLGATSTVNSPFQAAAYFPVTALADNDPAGVEYMAQGIDMSSLSTGNKITVIVYARSVLGVTGLDLRFYEDVGAGCTTAQTDYDALTLTAVWKMFVKTYEVTDGDCTSFIIYTGPVSAGGAGHDFANAAETGNMYAIYQVFYGTTNYGSYPAYIETAAASAAGGATLVEWLNSTDVDNMQDAAADVSKQEITVMPVSDTVSNKAAVKYLWHLDDGTTTTYHALSVTTGEDNIWAPASAANSTASGALTLTGGTAYTVKTEQNWGADTYKIFIDGTLKQTDTGADAPPANIDCLTLGAQRSSAGQGAGSAIKDFKFWRKK